MIKGKFVVIDKGQVLSFNSFDQIPLAFDNLISFEPLVPDSPHTDLEHEQIEQYQALFDELLKRERYASGN